MRTFTNKMRSTLTNVLLLLSLALLVSCGGGSQQATPPPSPTPPPTDTDGDGVSDSQDTCPSTPQGQTVDTFGCSPSQRDSDNDGVTDDSDACASTAANANVDSLGCAEVQLDPYKCHSELPASSTATNAPYVLSPVITKLNAKAQYFDTSIREFGAAATGADHAQDSVAVFDGKVYVAYFDVEGKLKLARKPLEACVWTVMTLPYTQTDPDSHRAANIGISTNDRRIHIIWGQHADTLRYIATNLDNATDVTDEDFTPSLFGERQTQLRNGDDLGRLTYPRFITGKNGNLLVFWREGGSGNGNTFVAEYENGLWSTKREVIRGKSGGTYEGSTSRNAYLNTITYRNGQVHITWTWRETSNGSSNHDLMHAYTTDNGHTWLNSRGDAVGSGDSSDFKITLNSDALFQQVRSGTLANQCGQAVTSDGRVHVIQRYDNSYQYHRWGPNVAENNWTPTFDIGANGGRPKIYTGPNDSLWVVGINAGKIRIYSALQGSNNWGTWTRVYESAPNIRYVSSPGYVSGDDLVVMAQREADDPATSTSSAIDVFTFKLIGQ